MPSIGYTNGQVVYKNKKSLYSTIFTKLER